MALQDRRGKCLESEALAEAGPLGRRELTVLQAVEYALHLFPLPVGVPPVAGPTAPRGGGGQERGADEGGGGSHGDPEDRCQDDSATAPGGRPTEPPRPESSSRTRLPRLKPDQGADVIIRVPEPAPPVCKQDAPRDTATTP